jgi:menaquinone-dependent protoporphyrinogen oxidase
MLHILVVVGSRHGGTRGIADAVADEVRNIGHTATVSTVDDAPTIAGHDAVIIGSAIYMGNWLPEVRVYVERNQVQLARVPVWLFSSGPLGADHPLPTGGPIHLAALLESSGAREHLIFVGKLDVTVLGLRERLAVKLVKAPSGDFRDWEAIRDWARDIVTTLQSEHAAAPS